MPLYLSILILVAGFFILIKSADWLVDGASSIASHIGMSDLMIGLTIVAFGTSMPELLVNIIASAQGNTDIAIGNIVGSNIANTLLVIGSASLIAPLVVRSSTVWKEIPLSLLAAIALAALANDTIIDSASSVSHITRSEGIILLLFFFIFLYYSFGLKRNEDGHETHSHHPLMATGYILLSCALLPLGGKLVVDSSSAIASALGFSEAFIGLTLVAIGTSLPELVTGCVAVYRGKVDIAVGNVVGSNIFNIFWILGVSALIRPLSFNPLMNVDLLVVILSSVLLFYMVRRGSLYERVFHFWKQQEKYMLQKREGIIMLVFYVLYLVYITLRG